MIDTLSELKKELYIQFPSNDMLILPQTLQTDEYFRMKAIDSNFTPEAGSVVACNRVYAATQPGPCGSDNRIMIGPAATGRSFASLVRPIRRFSGKNLANYMAGEIGTYLYDLRSRA